MDGIDDETSHGCVFAAGATSVARSNNAGNGQSRLFRGRYSTQAIHQATVHRVGSDAAALDRTDTANYRHR